MATHNVTFYRCPSTTLQRLVVFDDVAKTVVAGLNNLLPGGVCKIDGASAYTDANDKLVVIPVAPFALAVKLSGGPAAPVVGVVGHTVTITPGAGLNYRLISDTYDSAWQASNVFTDVPGGTYVALIKVVGFAPDYASYTTGVFVITDLVATAGFTDVSTIGATDGTITGTITAGSGNYTIGIAADVRAVTGNPSNSVFTGLAAGSYTVDFIDLDTGEELHLPVTVGTPSFAIPDSDHFFVPKVQSLSFVHEITPDGITTFQTLDNVRLCKQVFPYFYPTNYSQKVCTSDKPVVQWQSNYGSHEVTLLRSYDDTLIASFPFIKKVQNIGIEEDYNITIRDDGAGQSRVYFTDYSTFPILVQVGDAFIISANADGFNGVYEVLSIGFDATLLSQYVVISVAYSIMPSSSAATGEFFENIVDFDIYESTIDFSAIPVGDYYLKIRAFTDTNEATPALSEPICVDASFPITNYITWKNTDNAFDVDYSTGIIHFRRLESRLFNRNPAGIIDVIRNTNGDLRKLRAIKQRQLLLEFFQLPPYLYELISVLFDNDFVQINGVEYQTEGELANPAYSPRFKLANSSIVVEQVDWFQNYNSNDLDGVEISNEMAGAWMDRQAWDASTNLFPATGGTGAGGSILRGNTFDASAASSSLLGPDGGIIQKGTIIRARIDNPGQLVANWIFIPTVTA